MEQVKLTARTPEDLIATAPVVVGFYPVESVMMLTFGGEHGFHARVDLGTSRDQRQETARSLADPAVREKVQRVVFLIYTRDHLAARAQWHTLRRVFDEAGIPVAECLRVEGKSTGRWCGLLSDIAVLRSFDISNHPFLASAISVGRVTHEDRADLSAILSPRVSVAAEEISPMVPTDLWTEAIALEHLVADCIGQDEDRTWAPLDDRELRVVLADLQVTCLRDLVWRLVERSNARQATEFWCDVAARAPEQFRGQPLFLAAFSAWMSGHGALAWEIVNAEQKLPEDQRTSGMGLVQVALEKAVPPATYEPMPREEALAQVKEAANG